MQQQQQLLHPQASAQQAGVAAVTLAAVAAAAKAYAVAARCPLSSGSSSRVWTVCG
jgi:hypothetical protein